MMNTKISPEYEEIDEAFEAIAIIGMVGRFPGANHVEQFWQNVRDGVESITHFTAQELLDLGHDPDLLNQPNYVKAKGIVEGIDQFDPFFFGFSPREAEVMDPQHRLFLECAWEALEQAGYDAPRVAYRIAVFAGVGSNSYLHRHLLKNDKQVAMSDAFQMLTANNRDFVPTRVSYHLNLTGLSINVNTACSSSLVAVSLACHSLLNYQCDMVLAGGVSLSLPQKTGYLYQEGMIMSPDGHCRAFDAQAQGTVGGEGVGIVVLKRLEDALADGDTIHAVIRGCAINNDGANKIGYTAPSVDGQASAIAEAIAMADVSPATISYVETHGTGTTLGDPIEIAALTVAFQSGEVQSPSTAKQYCAIGSVKSNIGHTDAAAGVAGLIKAVQALKHQQLPPSLHYTEPNPKIDFANSPFYVNHTLQPWPQGETPRRAGISSFGIGGTNAHVVLEEAPQSAIESNSRAYQLLPLSAKTPTALLKAVSNLANHLRQQPDLKLADVAFTLTNRRPFSHRYTVLAQSTSEAIAILARADESYIIDRKMAQEKLRIAFMFSGQGTQYVNMGRDLYASEPVFRETMDHCAALLRPYLDFDLCQLLYPIDYKNKDAASKQLRQTAIAQPALFATEYALAKLWMAWGIQPVALIGHSIGEYVAACLAGVLTLSDALALVATRGQLMQSMPSGAMIAVPCSAHAVRPYLNDQLTIAAINESDRCVIAGTHQAVAALKRQLIDKGLACRVLHTSHAFHSPMMAPILDAFAQRLAQVPLQAPTVPYISNCTGTWIRVEDATNPDYWVRHLRQTVRFADGLTTLSSAADLLLEVGPGRTLATFAQRHAELTETTIVTSLRHPQTEQSDVAHLLTALGQLWQQGAPIDWDAYYTNERRHRLPLPTYPFERRSYWVEASSAAASSEAMTDKGQSTLHRQPIEDWFYLPSWKYVALPRQTLPDQATWLLFVDEAGLGAQLADRLRQAQQHVVTVRKGHVFTQLAKDLFVIDPTNRDDYSTLWRSLANVPQKIIHLWNISQTPDSTLADSFFSLLYLAQAIGEHYVTDTLDIFIIANHLYNVTGTDEVQPIKATLLGPTRVWSQEYENMNCRAIDVMYPQGMKSPHVERRIVSQLLNEFATDTEQMKSVEPLVAYRGQRRWLSCVEPIRLPASPAPIRTGGTYLITGGLGGIGLTLAEALAPWQTNLVLWSRSPLPTRSTWDEWLASHPTNDPTSQKIHGLQRIESKGGTVLVQAVDVADADAVKAAIDVATASFGPLLGLIHAAGIGGDNLIHQTDDEAVQAVLAPKVAGTLILHECLKNMPLEFMVLCSSLSSFLGGLGQVAYTAANAFQDAFAQSGPTTYALLSINWDAWREVGMAAFQFADNTATHPEEFGLSPDEGSQLFFRALASDLPQLLLSTHEFEQRRLATQAWRSDYTLGRAIQPKADIRASKQNHHRPNMGTAYVPLETPVEQWLAEIWQTHLGIEEIGRDDDFFQHLAGDSLGAMGLINRIQDRLGATLHLQAIFEAPSIREMATYLQEHYANRLMQLALAAPKADNKADNQADSKADNKSSNQAVQTTSQPKPNMLKQDTPTAAFDSTALLNQLDQLSEAELDAALATLLKEQA